MADTILNINLFGACIVESAHKDEFSQQTIEQMSRKFALTGAKQRALVVLLATAPFGRRTRSFLQNTLWGTSCYEGGRQNLRRALADIKKIMGSDFDCVVSSTNTDICLDMARVRFIGHPGAGEFLEGIDIGDEGFEDWLRSIRADPSQIHALYSPSSGQTLNPVVTPTIAILPFLPIGGDDSVQVMGDWVSEEISRALSRSNLISVISHLSSRQISKHALELDEIRERLGVDYCVYGSMRQIGEDLVLDADMLDAASGRILFTRNFTAPIAKFLSLGSSAIGEIVQTIGRMIAQDAMNQVHGCSIENLADHRLLVAGVGLMHQLRLASFARSRELIEEAVRRAPRSAESHAWLAEWYVMSIFNGWSTDVQADTSKAIDNLARGLDIDPENAFCLTIDGAVHNNLLHRFDIAEKRFDKALNINPNESLSWLFSGVLNAFRDEGEAAVSRTRRASQLSPMDPLGYFFDSFQASANLAKGDFENALKFADRSLATNARHLSTHRARICALHHLGRQEDANNAAVELMRRQPDFTVKNYLNTHPAREFNFGKMHIEALLAAGVPEGFQT